MPPRKKPSKSAKALYRKQQPFACDSDAPWGGWINIKLDDEQRQAAQDAVDGDDGQLVEALNEIIGAGMKMTVAYDLEHDCWICSFTGALVRADDGRYTCTTRAASMSEATLLATWKHVYLAKGDYGKFVTSGDNYPTWG